MTHDLTGVLTAIRDTAQQGRVQNSKGYDGKYEYWCGYYDAATYMLKKVREDGSW